MKVIKKIVIYILTLESRLILRKYRSFIVAITGSVGKTSAKDAIYCTLKDESHYVRKSEKSLNSDIGLPLTVIGVPTAWRSFLGWWANISAGARLIFSNQDYPDCLIIELGADHPGDIRNVAAWLRPDIAVITKVSSMPVHVEFFASPEEVLAEKASLAEGVKSGGTVILFADDEKVMSIAERVKQNDPRIITYGLKPGADIVGADYAVRYSETGMLKRPVGFSFTVSIDGISAPLSIGGVIGETYQYPLLAAAAVGKARGMPREKIIKVLSSYDAPKGRMNIIVGKNGSTIIDDTYNSSPDAAEAALHTLQGIQSAGRKIAILGDMMELGKFSAEEHRKIGKLCAGVVSRLITVGQRSRGTADEAVASGLSANSAESFDTSREAAVHIADSLKSGDLILVKGSQSVRMEWIVRALMEHPEHAVNLLARQEKEWLEKV